MSRSPSRNFAQRLIEWYARSHRELPWRRTRDPYRIWVSEVMLQQTRSQTVIPYYEKFLERFSTVQDLARAPEDEVLACWSGLGYYSRARSLHRAARRIAEDGRFPDRYDRILELPGVGDYTAAAIASIAFSEPYAVLDGNVLRVISRLENDGSDIASAKTRIRFRETAQQLLDPKDPGRFNQAMMELGATICLPKAPKCPLCPVVDLCQARRQGTAEQLPVKLRRAEPVRIESILVVAQRKGSILFWQRTSDSRRMAGFWELPTPEQLPGLKRSRVLGSFRHSITHHNYVFTVIEASISRTPRTFRWFSREELDEIPLSTTARKSLRLL